MEIELNLCSIYEFHLIAGASESRRKAFYNKKHDHRILVAILLMLVSANLFLRYYFLHV